MNKNVLIAVLVLIVIILGVVLLVNNGSLRLPTAEKDDGIMINTTTEIETEVGGKNNEVRKPPALPN